MCYRCVSELCIPITACTLHIPLRIGFAGLPPEWRLVLKASGITKEEAVEHPQAVLDALAFHMDGGPTGANKQKQALRQKLPTQALMQKSLTEVRSYYSFVWSAAACAFVKYYSSILQYCK
jgi:P21-Rho-binding domain